MVMSEIQLTFVKETLQYKLFKEDFENSINANITDNMYNPFEFNDNPFFNNINFLGEEK